MIQTDIISQIINHFARAGGGGSGSGGGGGGAGGRISGSYFAYLLIFIFFVVFFIAGTSQNNFSRRNKKINVGFLSFVICIGSLLISIATFTIWGFTVWTSILLTVLLAVCCGSVADAMIQNAARVRQERSDQLAFSALTDKRWDKDELKKVTATAFMRYQAD